MTKKILTISIAAYNVENYIKTTLESLVTSKVIDDLEIFVIDDGGNDNTFSIAKKYQEQFPNSVIPVHKENGGYGTTVNYSIENSSAKYFKLLDGDDWFQTDELEAFIEHLKYTDSDVVVTPFLRGRSLTDMEKIDYSSDFPEKEILEISQLRVRRMIGMWALTYKTEILKKSHLKLPAHMFYTDQLYSLFPFAYAKTIEYVNNTIYFYRLDREGQSVSTASRIKNMDMIFSIFRILSHFTKENQKNSNYYYILHRVTGYYIGTLKTILLLPIDNHSRLLLKKYDNEIKTISTDIYNNVTRFGKFGTFIKVLRLTNYTFLWILKLFFPAGYPKWRYWH
ncbi:glycosyltransferase family 2 protein [Streptococcus marimammalium]|uniref:glycosyltransferase family 2 protein n=1 Tax=Streptococcus marimammalium TaxID=269666 RepID=UPI00037DF4D8|nr:glycosyltransferase family 2 protein [Streptococcus marimammalium]